MKESQVKKTKEIVNSFLEKLCVNARASVFAIEEYLKIEIEGKDSSLLIGYHGDNLKALRQILTFIIKKEVSEDAIIMVDVSGYIAEKESRIQKMAQKAIDKVKKTGNPEHLPEMNAFERRIAHSYISDQGYASSSEGEGRNRHVVISK